MQKTQRPSFELPSSRLFVPRAERSSKPKAGGPLPRLTSEEIIARWRTSELPARWSMRFAPPGIITFGEELEIDRAKGPPHGRHVGEAVCLISGGRLAFRRLLAVQGSTLRLRCDVAPFEDLWTGDLLGYVRPRPIDRVASVNPARFTQANWKAAMAFARASSWKKRQPERASAASSFRTELLSAEDWPTVRAFWLAACGTPLPSEPHAHQQVVGLFAGAVLVGVNIHLYTGTSSYSAFTLVHPDYRGKGGGRAMIEHSLRLARARGNERVFVHIDARNFASMTAYRHAGFRPTGYWSDDADPMAAAERQWRIFEVEL